MINFEPQCWQQDEFEIDTDPTRLDLDTAYDFIAGRSYWAKDMPRTTFARSVKGAVCFGVYHDEQMIGFARVITDGATIAYLGDVYIDEAWRGRNLSKWLMRCIDSHPDLQGMRRWILVTSDAHSLYEQFGYSLLDNPDRYMERVIPNIYQKKQDS